MRLWDLHRRHGQANALYAYGTVCHLLRFGKRASIAAGPASSRAPATRRAAVSTTAARPESRTRQSKADNPQPKIAQLDDIASLNSSTGEVPPPTASTLVDEQYLSKKKYADLSISPESKRALAEVFRYERCSRIQAAAIPVCLGRHDVIAKAKTGTGKTLAFVIPIVEKVLANRARAGKVSALILSPTRELARQIHEEATRLLTFHTDLHAMVVYGGVDREQHIRELSNRVPDILIATPGRCWDFVRNRHSYAKAPFLRSMLSHTRVLVLDEADYLLDLGFRLQINDILARLPPTSQRQTFLFSATFPNNVRSLANAALKSQHRYVNAVGGDEPATPSQVSARSMVVPLEQLRGQLAALLALHMAQEPEYKIIVFLPTTALTSYFAKLFSLAGLKKKKKPQQQQQTEGGKEGAAQKQKGGGGAGAGGGGGGGGGPGQDLTVVELHSRLSQSERDQAAAEFQAGSRVVLFSSDVSARGMDYPGVTLVVQLGAPSNRDQYIHRTGRTGRAGRTGEAALLLADFEASFLDYLEGLNVKPMQPLKFSGSEPPQADAAAAEPPLLLPSPRSPEKGIPMSAALATQLAVALRRASERMGGEERLAAFQSLLGYYKGHKVLRLSPMQLVQVANRYAVEVMGCRVPPPMPPDYAAKIGLTRVTGLVLEKRFGAGRGLGGKGAGRRGAGGGRGMAQAPPAEGRREEGEKQPGSGQSRSSTGGRGTRGSGGSRRDSGRVSGRSEGGVGRRGGGGGGGFGHSRRATAARG